MHCGLFTPCDSHARCAIAALEAGSTSCAKKPLAHPCRAPRWSRRRAGARQGCAAGGLHYRRVPAVALARKLVADGRLGELRHVRAQYCQDWIVDPAFPLVWRLEREKAGSGALGDIGSHIVDTAQFITGRLVTGVSAITETFIKERPLAGQSTGLSPRAAPAPPAGHLDDALFSSAPRRGRARPFEATRFATGARTACASDQWLARRLAFDFEALNELWFHDGTLPAGGRLPPDPVTEGTIRTSVPGGRPATDSGTSTPSPRGEGFLGRSQRAAPVTVVRRGLRYRGCCRPSSAARPATAAGRASISFALSFALSSPTRNLTASTSPAKDYPKRTE